MALTTEERVAAFGRLDHGQKYDLLSTTLGSVSEGDTILSRMYLILQKLQPNDDEMVIMYQTIMDILDMMKQGQKQEALDKAARLHEHFVQLQKQEQAEHDAADELLVGL